MAEGRYPVDTPARAAKRAQIRERAMVQAEAFIARAGKSIVCGEYRRHDTCAGAIWCLCECHDGAS